MTLPTTLDVAGAGVRRAYPQAKPKPQADFGASFERAERTQRPAADDRPAARTEPKIDAGERVEEQAPADDAAQAQAPAQPEAEAAPQADAAEASEAQQVVAQADAEAAQAQAAAEAEATRLAAEAAQAAEALTADATLALMIATGGAATPAATPVTAEVAAGSVAAEAVAQIQAGATNPLAAAVAQVQAEADAQAAAPAATAATPTAPAAATPGSLGEAARALGLTGVQTTTAGPAQPADAPANLGLALADAEAAEAADLPITLTVAAAPLDEAAPAPAPLPAFTEDGDALAEDVAAEAAPTIPQLNGDRPLSEPTRTGQPAAAKVDAPVRPDDVLPQLLKHADAMKAQQANSIKLQLYPEHLGKMEIKVTSHQGVLTAQISADTQNVKAMLETQVVNLQRSLQDLGLKLDKVEVTLAGSGLGGFDTAQGQAFGQQPGQQGHTQTPRYNQATGYEAWLPDEPAEGGAWAASETNTAVNYVA